VYSTPCRRGAITTGSEVGASDGITRTSDVTLLCASISRNFSLRLSSTPTQNRSSSSW
jgi:hypothetical protein